MKWANKTINSLEEKSIIKIRPAHFKARLIVSLILLGLSTLGVFITVFAPRFAWHYWVFIVPIFAILCIWLSWYVSRSHRIEGSTILHEIIHWVALLVAVLLVYAIVDSGIINYLPAALFVLILLALTIFLAGVYFDAMFMLIGVLLALLAAGSALFVKYLVVIFIPAAALIAIVLIWRFRHQHKQAK